MTHKGKATEIVSKFMKYKVGTEYRYHTLLEAKQCALIAVDLVMDYLLSKEICFIDGKPLGGYKYWQAVRTEIEKL